MLPKHTFRIKSKSDLLNHFTSSQKLEIVDIQLVKDILKINFLPELFEDAEKRDQLSFNLEFVQKTRKFTFERQNLQYLHLISFLTNLTELNLVMNKISDISVISKLKNLKKLDLSTNIIADLSALQSLASLRTVDLSGNIITSYTIALPNLIDLNLGGNELQNTSGLQFSPQLLNLNLSKTKTTNLSTIPLQLFHLRTLNLSCNDISEIVYISNFLDLQTVNLSFNRSLQNIEPLKYCTQLIALNLNSTCIADIWPLQYFKTFRVCI
ncbi:leucine-rich_repeat domain-containing protein [Hexamita inflata]|uniref:Leucine-rich repeat domain-containing protein n=1 Tax=Hexamita inflata TaxID=28002 RepID=A0AA86R3R9_9EUKA|nr:leucine-rich repeat domain-containing protein [Hexamita inflata]CAI9971159.1 leucine-rich repeat domain-containing protein [Hexamita inflata]